MRYADDSVVGFRTQWQAQQFLVQLQERLTRFGLSLNASKARLIEFGRFAARNRRKRGLGKPERFDFLGFTHCCSSNRSGGFQILRLTLKKRMRATLLAIRDELKRRRHESVHVAGQWLTQVVRGYFNYHAVPGNLYVLAVFARRFAIYGGKPSYDAVSAIGSNRHATVASPTSIYLNPEMHIRTLKTRFASHTRGRSRMR